MLDLIKQLDVSLFIFINHLPHNFLLDTLFGFLSFAGIYGGVFLGFAFVLYLKNRKKVKKQLTALLVAEILYIIFVEMILKNIIVRPRPQFSIADVVLPYDFSHSFSFPSGHSTIVFAAAFILGRGNKRLKWFYYLLAFLIAFSRIYLGKHYPSDVLAGAVIGWLIGFYSFNLVGKLAGKIFIKPTNFQL